MQRHYYLLKSFAIVIAIVVATITSGVGTTRVAHVVNQARYSAPAEVQAAAWRTTAYIARGIAHIVGFDVRL